MDGNDLLEAAYIYDEFFTEKDNTLNWLNSKNKKVDIDDKPKESSPYLALPIFSGWL